jgi:sialic acid synthase SpsE
MAGADAVKFQSFTAEGMVARRVRGPDGDLIDNFVYPIIERLTLPAEWHEGLQRCARAAGVEFLSAPFDLERLALLHRLDVGAIKIASGDLTYDDLLRAAARTGRPILLSTGMSYLEEIEHAVSVLRGEGNEQIVLLHCVTSYPTPLENANIRAIQTLAEKFRLPVGLSDHSAGLAAPLAAVAMGACVIERHFTLSRTLPGPDHSYAMEPSEFRAMMEEVRRMELALGSGRKEPHGEETNERRVGRRSVVAARALEQGAVLVAQDLRCVRPGGGIEPTRLPELVGKRLTRALACDEPLSWKDVQ